MAIISVGYDGIVNESQWSDMIKKIGSAEYGVVGVGDWKVTSEVAALRTVSIAAGKGWGHGVFDDINANITIQLDAVTSGSRWDLIAMRRDWTGAGGVSSIVKVNGTSVKEIPAGRTKGPGTIDEQPLALVQITAGQTLPSAIVDLRCWAGNGGLFANNELALTYLEAVGSRVKVAGRFWDRIIDGTGNVSWTITTSDGAVPVFAPSSALDGGTAPAGGNFLIQAGSNVGASDDNGFGLIIFPKPFPNGLLTIIMTNGDSSVDRAQGHVITLTPAGAPYTTGSRTSVRYSVAVEDSAEVHRERRQGGLTHRVNWIAIGW